MKTYLRWAGILIVIGLLISGFGAGCSDIPSKDSVEAINRAIDELKSQPGRWELVLTNLIGELGNQEERLFDDLNDLLRGAKNAAQETIQVAGSRVQCDVDIIGIRVREKLEYLRDTILLDQEPPPPAVWVCGWVPTPILLDWKEDQWVSNESWVKLYGFNFTSQALDNAKVQLEDIQGNAHDLPNIQRVRSTSYEVHLGLQAEKFNGAGAGSKIMLLFPGDSQPYEIGIDIKSSPPAPPSVELPSGPLINNPPGLTLGLRDGWEEVAYVATADLGFLNIDPIRYWGRYDKGFSEGQGFSWWTTPDKTTEEPTKWKLPAGVVLALRHSSQGEQGATAFGHNPVREDQIEGSFQKMWGSDCCGVDYPFGFHWYVSTGAGFNWDTDRLWAESLPMGTVLGLKQRFRNETYTFTWGNTVFDCMNANGPVPPGYKRIITVDNGAGDDSICWFEKVTGIALGLEPGSTAGVLGVGLEWNVDRAGSNYTRFSLEIDDPRICQAYCYSDPRCNAWTHVHRGIQGTQAMCWLKGTVPASTTNKECCVSGVATKNP